MILNWCNKNNITVENITIIKFNLAIITFYNAKETNSFLNKLNKSKDKKFDGYTRCILKRTPTHYSVIRYYFDRCTYKTC